jgi:dTDP-4-dehydrorhamnose 3,5-epimerase
MLFATDKINGVISRNLTKHNDQRGWLTEVFRDDELENFDPVMCYVSMTLPGICRGPHEHREQTDYFVFTGTGTFEIRLWDNRDMSATYGNHQTLRGGEENPLCVIVPPGVVHGYKNISDVPGLVINCPDRLFAGRHRSEPVDEIRHEEEQGTSFQM